jgi:anti-sigma factor RsiW
MCDFATKLTAWIDGQLASEDAADVQRHLGLCEECRARVEAYRHVSATFDAYCDVYGEAVMASKAGLRRPIRTLTLSAVGAAVALAALILLASRARVQNLPAAPPVLVDRGAAVLPQPMPAAQTTQTAVANSKPGPRLVRAEKAERARHAVVQPRPQTASTFLPGPAVEIAIPGDAIFPPGALPEGVSFTADVTIAPDGSAQQMRVRPQLTEFERRSTQP